MLHTHNTTNTNPRIPFEKIAADLLGSPYELSLVLMADTLARKLNKKFKKKNNPTNVLSFPYTKNEGEIFLNIRRAERDAKKYGHTPREHITFLFIHGCLHLKGHTHSPNMEKQEEKLLALYT